MPIQAGSDELLLDDIGIFVDRLKSQGGTVTYQEWSNMFHCWHIFASEVTEGQQAIQSAGDFARSIWERGIWGGPMLRLFKLRRGAKNAETRINKRTRTTVALRPLLTDAG
jgi:hypothetical protein